MTGPVPQQAAAGAAPAVDDAGSGSPQPPLSAGQVARLRTVPPDLVADDAQTDVEHHFERFRQYCTSFVLSRRLSPTTAAMDAAYTVRDNLAVLIARAYVAPGREPRPIHGYLFTAYDEVADELLLSARETGRA